MSCDQVDMDGYEVNEEKSGVKKKDNEIGTCCCSSNPTKRPSATIYIRERRRVLVLSSPLFQRRTSCRTLSKKGSAHGEPCIVALTTMRTIADQRYST